MKQKRKIGALRDPIFLFFYGNSKSLTDSSEFEFLKSTKKVFSNLEKNAISKKSRPLKISRNTAENQMFENSKTLTKVEF